MSKVHLSIISFILLITTSMTVWSTIPPLTVNQNIGIPDTSFNNLSAGECRQCHNPYYRRQTIGVVYPLMFVAIPYVADRHHQHTGTPIAGGSVLPPFMDADGDLVDDTVYSCSSCHWRDGVDHIAVVMDCPYCHKVEGEERTVHHDTPLAKEAQCAACHGSVVSNLDAGLPPLEWQAAKYRPWISNKPNGDPNITSLAGTHPGNCDFCHNATEIITGEFPPTSIRVYSNKQNHHGTGVPTITDSSKGSPCLWCHPKDDSFPADERIRICERCHDVSSLHSIQYDADGDDGIALGLELPYQGHVGRIDDCWGCHGFGEADAAASMSMPPPPPLVMAITPQLDGVSMFTWEEGTEFGMMLSGNGFINQGGLDRTVTYRPTVQLTDRSGGVTVLTPIAESVDSVHVTIPATLPAGNYGIQIKKDDKLSNPIGVTITPAINVPPGAAICLVDYRVVIVRGEGFNFYEDLEIQGVGITGDGVDASRLFVWRDGMIAARFNAGCPSTVTVNSVFDSVTLTPEPW